MPAHTQRTGALMLTPNITPTKLASAHVPNTPAQQHALERCQPLTKRGR